MSGSKKKRFSDFAEQSSGLDGEKLSIDKVINLEAHILGVRVRPSKYPGKNKSGLCLYMQLEFEEGGPKFVLFTGSDVLIAQAKTYEPEVPFWTTIRKVDKYYTMS